MQIDNQWHTVLEFIVHRLVVPCSHADKSANAATQNRKREQRGLGDAPLGTPCLPLVNAIYKEGCDVDGNEIYCKYDMNIVHDDNAKLRNWLDFTKSYNIHYIYKIYDLVLSYHSIQARCNTGKLHAALWAVSWQAAKTKRKGGAYSWHASP